MGTSAGSKSQSVTGLQYSLVDFPTLITPSATDPCHVDPKLPTEETYANTIVPMETVRPVDPIPHKEVTMVGDTPHVKWMEEEVNRMNRIENLQ
ncbi:hypothetical protein KY289_001221 [Solanum tuberosum]|nr:hypothetical protein KY289_001221 [Solanum tuberosum]